MTDLKTFTTFEDGIYEGNTGIRLKPGNIWTGTIDLTKFKEFTVIEYYREFEEGSLAGRGHYNSKEKTWVIDTTNPTKTIKNESAHGQDVRVELQDWIDINDKKDSPDKMDDFLQWCSDNPLLLLAIAAMCAIIPILYFMYKGGGEHGN
jgi:hypothetical protein